MKEADIFEYRAAKAAAHTRPLAERMRPRTLEAYMGQVQAVGPETIIRHSLKNDRVFSMILWGPPGCGKTTLAGIIAAETSAHHVQFSAVLSGVKDIRAVIETAGEQRRIHGKKTLLFVDEIHRFNKSQQDAFLHHVESGLITLIGATTENPSFHVIAPLLSRCRVITLEAVSEPSLEAILNRALTDTENGLGRLNLTLSPPALAHLVRMADGDARSALNSLEVAAHLTAAKTSDQTSDQTSGQISNQPSGTIELADAENAVQRSAIRYDKSGEEHFNLISAFHKSLRGSDPDAALYWLARMLASGEDPFYVARRMVRFASEDVGNADPYALRVALDAVESFRFLGHPEGDLALAQAAVYLATAPKSNSVYMAYKAVKAAVETHGGLPVPSHIRNAPTALMKELGYGKGYQYAHDHPDGFVPQDYLPDSLKGERYYHPTSRGFEKTIKGRLDKWHELKEKADNAS